MRAYFHPCGGAFADTFWRECVLVAERRGFEVCPTYAVADVAVAPMLGRAIAPEVYNAPSYGTLIFHPSALPYRRGPDAIRWAVAAGERVSASTWFWCSDGLDEGDVCEQEVVVLRPGESAGRAYHTRFVPAGLRALRRALDGVLSGSPRRAAQDPLLSTYDGRFEKKRPAR